jgi:alpha-beta hydrolase superfamily lysophospholipase
MNRVNAPDGTPLVYDAYEPSPSAPPPHTAVLLLHGWADEAAPWAATATRLRDAGFAAYALDQRGHGRSGGQRLHLSRFSQLLGDLQAFRRAVRRQHDVPQVLFGHGFGGLVVLRYLETQPGEPPAAAIVSNPWVASRRRPAVWKRLAAQFADLWPTLPTGRGQGRMSAGARAEIQWAQRAVLTDYQRIECAMLFLLAGNDQVVDTPLARTLAEQLRPPARVQWYPELGHESVKEAHGAGKVGLQDLLAFLTDSQSFGSHSKE